MTKFVLAFVLVDLGNEAAPLYKTMCSEMIRSARRAFKDHEMTVVQITDNQGINHPEADAIFALGTRCKEARVCQFKGWMQAEFAIKNPNERIVFCDVDLIWNNDRVTRCFAELPRKVNILKRDWACMPYNSGIIVTEANIDFWHRYQDIIGSLPIEMQGWYADQYALALAVAQHEAANTFYADKPGGFVHHKMEQVAPAPDTQPEQMTVGWCTHFKGPTRKAMMIRYARMLDSGDALEAVRPGYRVTEPWTFAEFGKEVIAVNGSDAPAKPAGWRA